MTPVGMKRLREGGMENQTGKRAFRLVPETARNATMGKAKAGPAASGIIAAAYGR